MFNIIKKIFKKNNQVNIQNVKNKKSDNRAQADQKNSGNEIKIPKSIDSVKSMITQEFSLCSDFIIREILLGKLNIKIIIASIEGFVDQKILSENIIEPIMQYSGNNNISSVVNLLKSTIVSSGDLKELNTLKDTIDSILNGDAVLFIDGEKSAFKIGLSSPEKRPIGEPNTEISIKGSREAFTEHLRTNITLLRRRIKNINLKVESLTIGERTNTQVAICYLQGIAKPELIAELKKRIYNIKTDAILASGYVEEFIQDDKYSFFPMVGNSEKPDKVAAKILEGRIAIIVDGAPIILTVPYLFIESIQASEDYYGEYFFGSLMRLLRLAALFLSIYLPALYVALTSFHQTIIPFKLLITIAAAREGIPFSSFIETLGMVIVFELLREAGLRMPRAIGQAVSIVGAIVLGDAAVSAGIASAPVVIVAALSGICSFIVPPYMKTGSILKILMLIVANMLGLLGIGSLTIVIVVYLCSIKSFGVPYLSPFTPFQASDIKDTLIVVPIWAMFKRPRSFGQNTNRTVPESSNTRGKQHD